MTRESNLSGQLLEEEQDLMPIVPLIAKDTNIFGNTYSSLF